MKKNPAALFCKRATDLALALAVTILAAPFLVLIYIAIRLDSPGSPLFTQKRVGKDGQFFDIYKFRTMVVGAPNISTELMAKMERSPITRVGALLRKTSIDELPQLINIFRGEMSLVGPRPALYNQYELTEERQKVGALSMPPGITGWAQVNGRDDLSDELKVQMDAWYCANWNYWLDWRILAKTVFEVIGGRGAR